MSSGAWETIEVSTPPSWRCFVGKRIGRLTFGFAAAVNLRFWGLAFEILTKNPGVAVMVGPFWFGIVALKAKTIRDEVG